MIQPLDLVCAAHLLGVGLVPLSCFQ